MLETISGIVSWPFAIPISSFFLKAFSASMDGRVGPANSFEVNCVSELVQ